MKVPHIFGNSRIVLTDPEKNNDVSRYAQGCCKRSHFSAGPCLLGCCGLHCYYITRRVPFPVAVV